MIPPATVMLLIRQMMLLLTMRIKEVKEVKLGSKKKK